MTDNENLENAKGKTSDGITISKRTLYWTGAVVVALIAGTPGYGLGHLSSSSPDQKRAAAALKSVTTTTTSAPVLTKTTTRTTVTTAPSVTKPTVTTTRPTATTVLTTVPPSTTTDANTVNFGDVKAKCLAGNNAFSYEMGAYWVTAANNLTAGPSVPASYSEAAPELRELAALPDAMGTPAQDAEMSKLIAELNTFFGTPGLYG